MSILMDPMMPGGDGALASGEPVGSCARPSMLRNFSFLEPGRIAGSALPGIGEGLGADVARLRKEGVGAIVSLTERPIDRAVVEEAGLQYLHLPVRDMEAPSIHQMRDFVDFAERRIREGQAVLVHCFAGFGRTGTMLAAWLVSQGMEAEEAILLVRRRRPGSIESPAQEEAIMRFATEHRRGPDDTRP